MLHLSFSFIFIYSSVDRELGDTGRLVIVTGVVKRSKCFRFEIMLWRLALGNIFYRQASEDEILEDPQTVMYLMK